MPEEMSEAINKIKEGIAASKNFKDVIGVVTNALAEQADFIPSFTTKISGLKDIINGFTGGMGNLASKIGLTDEILRAFGTAASDSLGKLASGSLEASNNMDVFLSGAVMMMPQFVMGLKGISGEFATVTKGSEGFVYQSANLTEGFNKMVQGSTNLPKSIKMASAYLQEMAERSDSVKNWERALFASAAAAGDAKSMLESMGDEFKNLPDKTNEFYKMTRDVGDATGLASNTVAKYALQLMKLPGAMGEAIDGTGTAADGMHNLNAIIQVAHGTGQKFEDVLKKMTIAYYQLGTSGGDALTMISRMYDAAQKTHLPMEVLQNTVLNMAQHFRFFGDNVQSSINIMARFGDALKESKMGPEAVADLVKGFTDGISKLDIAQKAFISGATGGPAGMRGAFEIDFLLREDRLDEVVQKVESALKDQFGGEIVSLEQARASDVGAAQMVRQVQFLTQGPFGALAQTTGQAYRILEAMAAGRPGEAPIMGEEEALGAALERGDEFNKQQITELVHIKNYMAHVANTQSQMARLAELKTVGIEGPLAVEIARRIAGAEGLAERGKIIAGEGGIKTGEAVTDIANETSRGVRGLGDIVGRLPEYAREQITKLLPEETQQEMLQREQQEQIERVLRGEPRFAEVPPGGMEWPEELREVGAVPPAGLGPMPGDIVARELAMGSTPMLPETPEGRGGAAPVSVRVEAVCPECSKEQMVEVVNRAIEDLTEAQEQTEAERGLFPRAD
jgi:hypothetical protein